MNFGSLLRICNVTSVLGSSHTITEKLMIVVDPIASCAFSFPVMM